MQINAERNIFSEKSPENIRAFENKLLNELIILFLNSNLSLTEDLAQKEGQSLKEQL